MSGIVAQGYHLYFYRRTAKWFINCAFSPEKDHASAWIGSIGGRLP